MCRPEMESTCERPDIRIASSVSGSIEPRSPTISAAAMAPASLGRMVRMRSETLVRKFSTAIRAASTRPGGSDGASTSTRPRAKPTPPMRRTRPHGRSRSRRDRAGAGAVPQPRQHPDPVPPGAGRSSSDRLATLTRGGRPSRGGRIDRPAWRAAAERAVAAILDRNDEAGPPSPRGSWSGGVRGFAPLPASQRRGPRGESGGEETAGTRPDGDAQGEHGPTMAAKGTATTPKAARTEGRSRSRAETEGPPESRRSRAPAAMSPRMSARMPATKPCNPRTTRSKPRPGGAAAPGAATAGRPSTRSPSCFHVGRPPPAASDPIDACTTWFLC